MAILIQKKVFCLQSTQSKLAESVNSGKCDTCSPRGCDALYDTDPETGLSIMHWTMRDDRTYTSESMITLMMTRELMMCREKWHELYLRS